MSTPKASVELDARDLPSPIMLVRLRRQLHALHEGEVLQLLCGHEDSLREVRAFCDVARFELLDQPEHEEGYVHWIRA